MKLFNYNAWIQGFSIASLACFVCLWSSPLYAQPTPQPSAVAVWPKPISEASPTKTALAKAEDIKKVFKEKKLLTVSDVAIDDDFDLNDSGGGTLTFRNGIFGDDLHLSGAYTQISYEHCLFNRNVHFFPQPTPIPTFIHCTFAHPT